MCSLNGHPIVIKHGRRKGQVLACALGYADIKASCRGLNSKERHSRALTLPLSFPPHPGTRHLMGPRNKHCKRQAPTLILVISGIGLVFLQVWPLPMWSSRFSSKDIEEYLSEARNACHANQLKLIITYKTARQQKHEQLCWSCYPD